MNRFSYRDELLRNAEAVGKFYHGIVGSWTDKLLREYKYKQALSEDTILQLEKIVRAKLTNVDRNSNKLFTSFLLKRESSRNECEIQGELEQVELTTPLKITTMNEEIQQTAVKTEQSKSVVGQEEEEEYVDDLAEFQTPPQQKIEVKVQNTASGEAKEEAKEQERERSEGSSQGDYNEQIEEKIGSAILGSFCSFHIKRKPKEEKIFLDLQNVFVKYSNSPFENYHTKIACELTKIEKEDIKELRK